MRIWLSVLAIFCLLTTMTAQAAVSVEMHLTSADNKSVGTITAENSKYGLLLTPHLTGLPPGPHGFHVHENPSCANMGDGAGGHIDPNHTGHHLGPYNDAGHLGDMPVLIVDKDGNATTPVLAPRLKLEDIINHSLMIHSGSDNYSDNPHMGGGGSRLACGVVK